jgi:hypothetical protein
MGPLSYMKSVVDRNVVMRRIYIYTTQPNLKNYIGRQNVTTLGDIVRLFFSVIH